MKFIYLPHTPPPGPLPPPQDRYLNNKTTKYLLRADRVQQGMDTIALFTKVPLAPM